MALSSSSTAVPSPPPPPPPARPAIGRLLQLALLRVVARAVDAVVLLPRPALLRLWWAGVMAAPSPYTQGFPLLIESRRHGVPVADFVYGEVFVAPTRRLLRRLGVGPGAVVVDLGCGRGAVLVASSSLGARARGDGDARQADVADADVVWVSWATWAPSTRLAVRARLHGLRAGALVCAVVHGVDDDLLDAGLGSDGMFEPVDTVRLWCSWGRATVVISRRC